VPSPVPSELETVTRATLVYDLATIDATMRSVAAAAHAHEIRVLFAAKSFPHASVLALAARHLDGFDAASAGELAELPAAPIVSICDPTGRAIASSPAAHQTRVIASIETAAQLAAAPATAEIAIRISASITGRDPAVGAVLDGSGHRRSRFGLDDRAAIAELVALAASRGRRWGLHVHHGPVTATTAERFLATAQAALALVDAGPAFLNLGGAWHGIADLPAAFAKLRAAIPREIELVVEPGRTFAAGAGFACGIVTAARSFGDRELRVIDLSRACHLRWSPVELVAPAPHPGHGKSVLIVGPTCYEEDTLGEWTVDPLHVAERVIVRDVPGYALAWNTGFAGIPPADVIVR
jgi:diaminopimelate decarboxylase